MHQISSTPNSSASASSVRCHVGRPVRCGAQGADTEPVQEHPVLLDRAHAPPACIVEPSPEERRVDRVGGEGVDPPLPLREVGRSRRDVPRVDDQRWMAEPVSELLDRVAARRRRIERVERAVPTSSTPTAAPPRGSRSPRSAAAPRVGSTTSPARRRGPARRRPATPPRPRRRWPRSSDRLRCDTSRRRRCRSSTTGATMSGLASLDRRGRSRSHLGPPSLQQLGRRVAHVDPERRREAGRHLVEVTVPTPDEPAVRDGDHLLVRMIQRGQQHVSLLDPGQQHAEHRRRVQVRRRVEVEVERGTGDHRQRELGVGEPEEARLPLDTDRDVGAESREPARRHAREISGRRQPDAFDPVGDRPFEHHALGQHRVAEVNERVHDTQIFVVSAPPMRFAIAVRRRFPACLTAGVDAAAVLEPAGGATARMVASRADVPRRRRLRLGPRPRVAPGVGVRGPRLRARRARGLPDAAGRGLPPRRHPRRRR